MEAARVGSQGVAGDPVEIEADGEEFGSRRTALMTEARKPRKEEVIEHEKTHLPFRSWCRHCVRGRGKEAPHKQQTSTSTFPEVHLDFMFLG